MKQNVGNSSFFRLIELRRLDDVQQRQVASRERETSDAWMGRLDFQ